MEAGRLATRPPLVRSLRGHEVCPEEDRPDHRDEQDDEPEERELLAPQAPDHPGDGQDRRAEHEVHPNGERCQAAPPADPEHQGGDRDADEQRNEVALGLLRRLLLVGGRVIRVDGGHYDLRGCRTTCRLNMCSFKLYHKNLILAILSKITAPVEAVILRIRSGLIFLFAKTSSGHVKPALGLVVVLTSKNVFRIANSVF